jgi:hypothetical protein
MNIAINLKKVYDTIWQKGNYYVPLHPDMHINNKLVNIVLAVIAACLLALCVASVMNVK